MKVLFATFPMAFHTPGGGEIQILAYEKHLSRIGVDVVRFDPWNPKFMDHDLVHFFSCAGGSAPFCQFVKRLGLPLVVTSTLWITEATKSQYNIGDIAYQLSIADRVIGNSDMEGDTLSSVLGVPRDRFVTVYNAVDELFLQRVSPELFRSHFGLTGPFVLNVANIEPRKNQLALIRAMKSFPNMKLALIGHQRDPKYARQCFTEMGSQGVYLGSLPHDSELLRSAYAACDAFCLPSTLETPGLAALEAFVSGCKVALTSEGSTREYFGSEVDYLEPHDVASIVESIRCTLSRAPVEFDAQFLKLCRTKTWPTAVMDLKNIYQSLLK